jgi:hypothetical protein
LIELSSSRSINVPEVGLKPVWHVRLRRPDQPVPDGLDQDRIILFQIVERVVDERIGLGGLFRPVLPLAKVFTSLNVELLGYTRE